MKMAGPGLRIPGLMERYPGNQLILKTSQKGMVFKQGGENALESPARLGTYFENGLQERKTPASNTTL